MAETLFTYRELTRIFPVREGTLRSWVSDDEIQPRAVQGRRKLFAHTDIQRAYDRRHPEPAETR